MIRLLYIIVLMLAFLFPVYGQENFSIHELHKKQFGNQPPQKSFFDSDGKDIIPISLDKINTTRTAVFGYLPYWEYLSERNLIKYDLITHIAAFDFQADANGNLKTPSYWPWTDVINSAHAKGVKIIMCVTNFTASQIKSIISIDANKQNFFTNVKNMIRQYSLDGVNIDFEGAASADRGALLNTFMTDLTNMIHKEFPEKEVSFAGPVVNWGGWNLLGLVKACDYIFIMGYDFYGSWSETTGPSSPLIGGTYNLSSALSSAAFGYGVLIPNYSQKLILGVPYYGNRWQVTANSPYSKVSKFVGSMLFSSEIVNSKTYGLQWDASSQTTWYTYKQDNIWIQDWFDNDSSTALKYNLADSKKLKGIGMWALGQDGSRPELWNLLRKRIIDDGNKNSIPAGFALSQNYPNPFNPATTIAYDIPKASFVQLAVYDMLGRQKAILVSQQQDEGHYKVKFDGSSLPSGVYIYTIHAGAFTNSKKLILVR